MTRPSPVSSRLRLTAAAALAALVCGPGSRAQTALQGLTVIPVTMEMAAGERARTLTIENHTGRPATFQVRPFAWSQPAGADQLDPTDALLVSPPIGSLAAGATQVVRIVLRKPGGAREASYRIFLDEIPAQPAAGQVGFVLRLSIPIFVEPPGRIAPQLAWTVQIGGDGAWLVARNEGSRRQVLRDIRLAAAGAAVTLEANASPYVLAGGVRRWRIVGPSPAPSADGSLRLTAHADTGEIDQAVAVRRDGP